MSHLGYFDPETDSTPLPQFVEAREAKRKARRAFHRGAWIGAAAMAAGILAADYAHGETIHIGRMHVNGAAAAPTTVTLAPSTEPGILATVTMDNRLVNQGRDDGSYTLSIDGLTVEAVFLWDADPVLGSDRITIIPPAGVTCNPEDCSVTVPEGQAGTITLYDYLGF